MGYYRNLDALVVLADGNWITYLPNKTVEQTHRDGIDLFSRKEKFDSFAEDFKKAQERSTNLFKNALSLDKIDQDTMKALLASAVDHFSYYSKTEFFYSDEAFRQSKDNPKLKENLDRLESVKNPGRLHLNRVFLEGRSYLFQVIRKLSDQFNIPEDDLLQYSMEEILNIFQGKTVDQNILQQRRETFTQMAINKDLSTLYDPQSLEIGRSFRKNSLKGLKGKTANPGKVKAKARVIRYGYDNFDNFASEIEEMNNGDILITETTSPEMILACKKASAIVTNQGGMMSHAAIFSREAGIPCIVAVDGATESIATGDEIEVDADNGKVTIIKRAK